MERVKVLIADDHELIRAGIRNIVDSQRNLQLVGEARSGLQAVEKIKKLRPDVVILDLVTRERDAADVTHRIQTESPDSRVIILSMYDSELAIREALIAGATGYIMKDEIPSELKPAIKTVCKGRRYLSPRVAEKLAKHAMQLRKQETASSEEFLTSRELEVTRLLTIGNSSKEIGEALGISSRTAEAHRANIMRKLKVHSVTELVHSVLAHGLIDIAEQRQRSQAGGERRTSASGHGRTSESRDKGGATLPIRRDKNETHRAKGAAAGH
jgi:DNA-binding NarL/FixJ family response regulator